MEIYVVKSNTLMSPELRILSESQYHVKMHLISLLAQRRNMDKAKHRQWGNKDMLFYCPQNKLVWQYDNIGNIHKYKDLPSYGLPRKELPQ